MIKGTRMTDRLQEFLRRLAALLEAFQLPLRFELQIIGIAFLPDALEGDVVADLLMDLVLLLERPRELAVDLQLGGKTPVVEPVFCS